MQSDIRGVAQVPAGAEQSEIFLPSCSPSRTRKVQYDYRAINGELFSCVADSIQVARRLRKIWQTKGEGRLPV